MKSIYFEKYFFRSVSTESKSGVDSTCLLLLSSFSPRPLLLLSSRINSLCSFVFELNPKSARIKFYSRRLGSPTRENFFLFSPTWIRGPREKYFFLARKIFFLADSDPDFRRPLAARSLAGCCWDCLVNWRASSTCNVLQES